MIIIMLAWMFRLQWMYYDKSGFISKIDIQELDEK